MDKALQRLNTKFSVDLHPSKLSSVEKGVREHLHALLLRYNDNFDGVPLSFSNEKILTQQAHIHPYFPLVRLEISADIILFRPQVGMRLEGIVNKVGVDYIGLLVLGFVNAAIGAERIRQDLRCRYTDSCWASSSNPKHVITVGTKVYFTLTEVQRPGDFVSLIGELRRSDTGARGFTTAAAKQLPAKTTEKKKRKKHKQEDNTATPGAVSHQPLKKKKFCQSEQPNAAAQVGEGCTPLANGGLQQARNAHASAISEKASKKSVVAVEASQQQMAGGAGAAAGVQGAKSEKWKKGKKRKSEGLSPQSVDTPMLNSNGSDTKEKKTKKSKTTHA